MNVKPQRRTPEHTYKDYTKYKRWLREDFSYRCAYCFIHENDHGGHWHFQVDHYRPKSKSEFKHLETEYSNLLYSCDHCNNLKWDIWPSDTPLIDGVGWLDPCEHDLSEHYYYGYCEREFTIVCVTKVGCWMVKTLALDQPARIRRRRDLAEEERVDRELVELFRGILEEWTQEYNLHPTDEKSTAIAKMRRLLLAKEEQISNRYTPAPFEPLRRRSNSAEAQRQETTKRYQSALMN